MAAKKPAAPKALTPGRIAKLAANPGTRAALADKFLSPAQLKQRQMNRRLDAPVTQGSPLTNRALAHQTQAATTLQFAPQEQALNSRLGASQQTEKDQAGWYDTYKAELAKHRENIATNNTDANTAFQGLTGAVGKLGTGVEGTNAQGDAANAQAVRQSLLASFAGLQNETGKASTNYADTLAHVVAPGQALSAAAQGRRNTNSVRDQQVALGREKGAFGSKFTADTISGEQKNVLANMALTGKDAAAQSQENYRNAQIDLKRGIDPVTGKPLPKDKKTPTGYSPGGPGMNKYGYTYDEWTALSPAKQASARAGKPKATPGKGPEWLTQNEMGAGLSQLGPLKNFAAKAKGGQPFIAGHKPQPKMTRPQAVKKLTENVAAPKDPVLLSAALDAVYNQPPHLSAETVRRLIAAGYKPSRVAKTLGVPTAAGFRPSGPPKYKPTKGA